jgi:phage/plasmid-associated DNA primase
MKTEIEKYHEENLIVFTANIIHKKNKNGEYKKECKCPPDWQNSTLENYAYNKNHNSLGLLTGEKNGLIVIDIDNIEHWNSLLKEHNKKDPDVVKVKSGKGYHLYFKYTDKLKNIPNRTNIIKDHPDYEIDVRTNGGFIFVPPSSYLNTEFDKKITYEWIDSIFEYELSEMPNWLYDILIKNDDIIIKPKKETEKKKSNILDEIINEEIETKTSNIIDEEIDEENKHLKYDMTDIKKMLELVPDVYAENYDNWRNIGFILFNTNKNYFLLWDEFSKRSDKYSYEECEKKWREFKTHPTKKKLTLGTLIRICQTENLNKYNEIFCNVANKNLIISKFTDINLQLGQSIKINNTLTYTDINNPICLFKKESHGTSQNYVETMKDTTCIKCKHPECFGCIYPDNHINLTKNDIKFIFNGDININIENENDLTNIPSFNLFGNTIDILLHKALNCDNDESYATLIYETCKDKFVFIVDDNIWYVYNNHKWLERKNNNVELLNLITNKNNEYFTQLILLPCFTQKQLKTIKMLHNRLGNGSMKERIVNELKRLCAGDYLFIEKLDSNFNLIGFNNGVYDLTTFTFRDGETTDYISLGVNYDYTNIYSKYKEDVLKFIEDIQPNKDNREYLLLFLSTCLNKNTEELFTIFTNTSGRNGKSKLISLLSFTLGEYYSSVSSQLFTRPRPDNDAPDPGVLSLCNKRLITSTEPENGEKLNSGYIKFISGKDTTLLRNCHSNKMIKFSPKFTTILACNDIPECDKMDKPMWKRLRCINFPTEFTDTPIEKHHKLIDRNIDANFDIWKNDLMLILIDYYKIYIKTQKLIPTSSISKWTDKYKEDSDLYFQFLIEMTESSENDIHSSILYDTFKLWYMDIFNHTKIPSRNIFLKEIKKHKTYETHALYDNKRSCGFKNTQLKN